MDRAWSKVEEFGSVDIIYRFIRSFNIFSVEISEGVP
jgi:hypothetical protein